MTSQNPTRGCLSDPAPGLHGLDLDVAETWIRKRLDLAIFAGVTNREQRAGLLRAYLFRHDLADAPAWRGRGEHGTAREESWREVFDRVYGERLGEAP